MLSIDQLAYSSNLRTIDPKFKIALSCVTLLICVIARCLFLSAVILFVMGGLTLFWGKSNYRYYLRLLRIPIVFILLSTITIMVSITRKEQGIFYIPCFSYYLSVSKESLYEGVRIFIVAMGAISCMYFLTLSTPMADLLVALKELHVPSLLVEIMMLLYRFIFLIFAITDAISTAQKCRLSEVSYRTKLKAMSQMLAATFIRAMDQSGRIYDAMESRGYDGSIKVLTPVYKREKSHVILGILFEGMIFIFAILSVMAR